MEITKTSLAIAICAAFLTACGGGGGGTTPAATTSAPANTTFPLQQAINNITNTGYQKTTSVSGTINSNGTIYPLTGSIQVTNSPTISSTFNGQTALQKTVSLTGTVNGNNQSINIANSVEEYLTTTDSPIVQTSPSLYCVTESFSQVPTTVAIGSTGPYATFVCYTDSSMQTKTATMTLTYIVSAGTSPTTATASVIDVITNSANQQTGTEQTNYLIDTSGNASFLSVSVSEAANGGTINFTAQ